MKKIENAMLESEMDRVIIAGGVAANSRVRALLEAIPYKVTMPGLDYCTDNAAMIASAGYYKYLNSENQEIYYNYGFEAFSKLTTNSLG